MLELRDDNEAILTVGIMIMLELRDDNEAILTVGIMIMLELRDGNEAILTVGIMIMIMRLHSQCGNRFTPMWSFYNKNRINLKIE